MLHSTSSVVWSEIHSSGLPLRGFVIVVSTEVVALLTYAFGHCIAQSLLLSGYLALASSAP